MANQKHLDILKKGVDVWNHWRRQIPNIQPDLSNANLSQTNLVILDGGDVIEINLSRTQLKGADLFMANLLAADLSGANLSDANLKAAQLYATDLSGANLSRVSLINTHLDGANLDSADFYQAELGSTVFASVDLSKVIGLDTVKHFGPSTIGIDTIYRSQGNIPVGFLKGAGIDDTFIKYIRSLVGKPFEYYSCFISYSSKDQDFAERLYADLQNNDVRCWFAPEDMKIGDKIRPRIEEAIRIHDKLLLVLSEHSVESTWVEKEIETAFEKERLQQKLVLFPIRLDETVMQTTQAWAADIRRTRHIGNFSNWKSHDYYQKAFKRLLRDLKAETL